MITNQGFQTEKSSRKSGVKWREHYRRDNGGVVGYGAGEDHPPSAKGNGVLPPENFEN